jgi:hypothetical protein
MFNTPKICKVHGTLTDEQCYIQQNGRKGNLVRRCKLCRIASRVKSEFECEIHGKLEVDFINQNGTCKICSNNRSIGDLYECHKHGKLDPKDRGSNDRCNICRREWRQENKKKNPKKWEEIDKIEYQKRKEKYGSLLSLKKVCDSRGITMEQYHLMREKQNDKCSICLQPETRIDGTTKKTSRLTIDHCHTTREVRGLLCHSCNTAIGKFKDDPIRMYRAIRYVKQGGF